MRRQQESFSYSLLPKLVGLKSVGRAQRYNSIGSTDQFSPHLPYDLDFKRLNIAELPELIFPSNDLLIR